MTEAVLAAVIGMSSYTFAWPSMKLTHTFQAPTWTDAYEMAVPWCEDKLKRSALADDLNNRDIAEICQNPKQKDVK